MPADFHFWTTGEDLSVFTPPEGVWGFETSAFWTPPSTTAGAVPMYRFFSPVERKHFWTTDQNELINAGHPEYQQDKNIAFYVYDKNKPQPADTVELWRYFERVGLHHFWTAKPQMEFLNGWDREGSFGWVYTAQPPIAGALEVSRYVVRLPSWTCDIGDASGYLYGPRENYDHITSQEAANRCTAFALANGNVFPNARPFLSRRK